MDKFASVATAALLARPEPPMETFGFTAPPAKDHKEQQQHTFKHEQQLQRLEERMDNMQDHLLRTQQMIRELSTLVHRQIKVGGLSHIPRFFIVGLGSVG